MGRTPYDALKAKAEELSLKNAMSASEELRKGFLSDGFCGRKHERVKSIYGRNTTDFPVIIEKIYNDCLLKVARQYGTKPMVRGGKGHETMFQQQLKLQFAGIDDADASLLFEYIKVRNLCQDALTKAVEFGAMRKDSDGTILKGLFEEHRRSLFDDWLDVERLEKAVEQLIQVNTLSEAARKVGNEWLDKNPGYYEAATGKKTPLSRPWRLPTLPLTLNDSGPQLPPDTHNASPEEIRDKLLRILVEKIAGKSDILQDHSSTSQLDEFHTTSVLQGLVENQLKRTQTAQRGK